MPETMTTTTTKPRLKRGSDIRMQVSDDMRTRFQRIAGLYGMPPSTLAAFALGQWTAQQEASLRMVDTMADKLGGQIGEELRKQFALFDYKGEPKRPTKRKP